MTIRVRSDEQLARLLVGDQVELALAVALLDVGEPVVLVGRRAQRLGEQGPRVDPQRQLPAAGPERSALDADQVAEVESDQLLVVVAQHVLAGVQLDPPGAVGEVEERGLAVTAAARSGARRAGTVSSVSSPSARPAWRSSTSATGGAVREARRERVDAGGAQLVELAPALLDQAPSPPSSCGVGLASEAIVRSVPAREACASRRTGSPRPRYRGSRAAGTLTSGTKLRKIARASPAPAGASAYGSPPYEAALQAVLTPSTTDTWVGSRRAWIARGSLRMGAPCGESCVSASRAVLPRVRYSRTQGSDEPGRAGLQFAARRIRQVRSARTVATSWGYGRTRRRWSVGLRPPP